MADLGFSRGEVDTDFQTREDPLCGQALNPRGGGVSGFQCDDTL